MSEPTVLLRQRLRTTGLAVVLGIVMLVAVNVVVVAIDASRAMTMPAVVAVAVAGGVLVTTFFLLLATRIEVQVIDDRDERRLEVLYGPGALVRQRFRREDIDAATVEQLRLIHTGGWGYRGSLRFFHRAALVTRRGEALALELKGNRRFVVTVDRPEDFVRALGT